MKKNLWISPHPQNEILDLHGQVIHAPGFSEKKVISGHRVHSGGILEVESSLGWIEDEWEVKKWR